jgi:DNA-binding transcriptional LysR family regulator
MLDLHRLRLLRELSQRGTIASVAQALAYTPSAVSQQLAVLEREAGVALLERSGRGVRLTPAARTLVRHAHELLAELERAEAALAEARGQLTAVLRIGAFPSAARALLPPALVALGTDHPGLELSVTEVDPVRAAALVRAGDLDAALTHDYDLVPADDSPSLETPVLLVEPMYLASTRPPRNRREPLASFRDVAWVMGSRTTLCRQAAERACAAAGFAPKVRHEVDDFATVLALVAAGQGPAIVPRMSIVEGTPPGVVLTELAVARRTRLTHRRGAGSHPAVAALSAAVQKVVAQL